MIVRSEIIASSLIQAVRTSTTAKISVANPAIPRETLVTLPAQRRKPHVPIARSNGLDDELNLIGERRMIGRVQIEEGRIGRQTPETDRERDAQTAKRPEADGLYGGAGGRAEQRGRGE